MAEQKRHRSTARVVEVLDLLADDGVVGMTLSELAARTAAPKSSLLPILRTLTDSRFLLYDRATGRYRIGQSAYRIGEAYLRGGGVGMDVLEIMRSVSAECGETCYFGERFGNEVVYLLSVESPEPIRMVASPGKRLYAHSTAIGKALLADSSEKELRELFPAGLPKVTPQTITDFDELICQLEDIGRTGVSHEKEESNPDVECVGVPLYVNGRVRAALSIATPIFRYTRDKERQAVRLLLEKKPLLERILSAVPDEQSLLSRI